MSKSMNTTKLTPHHRVDILHHDSGLDYKNKFCIVMVTGLYPLSPAALFYTHCTPAMLSYQHTNWNIGEHITIIIRYWETKPNNNLCIMEQSSWSRILRTPKMLEEDTVPCCCQSVTLASGRHLILDTGQAWPRIAPADTEAVLTTCHQAEYPRTEGKCRRFIV